MTRDLYTMGRIVLWLLFLTLVTPVAAVLVHAVARAIWGLDLDH